MALRFQPPPFDPTQIQYGPAQLGQQLGQGISTAFDRIVQGLIAGRQRREGEAQKIQANRMAMLGLAGEFAKEGLDPGFLFGGPQQVSGPQAPLGVPQPLGVSPAPAQAQDAGLFGQFQQFQDQFSILAGQRRKEKEFERGKLPRQTEKDLRDEFRALSKDFLTIRDSYNRIEKVGRKSSAAGDLALIFNYMKMLDPGSVVRESEFANAQNAASVPERVRGQWNRALNGERLSDKTRQDFLERAQDLHQAQVASHGRLEGQYRGLAERAGVNPENVTIDLKLPEAERSGGLGAKRIAVNPQTGERVQWNGSAWVPVR